MVSTTSPMIFGPADGESVTLQTVGVRFMIPGADTDTRFSLVEHPIPPRGLAAPLHRHHREDEYSFVIEGRMGALLGDDVVEAGPGDLVYKPRGQWHTFWNAADEPARILEIISPRRLRAVLRRTGAADLRWRARSRRLRRAVQPLRARHAARQPARTQLPLRGLVPGRRVAPPAAAGKQPRLVCEPRPPRRVASTRALSTLQACGEAHRATARARRPNRRRPRRQGPPPRQLPPIPLRADPRLRTLRVPIGTSIGEDSPGGSFTRGAGPVVSSLGSCRRPSDDPARCGCLTGSPSSGATGFIQPSARKRSRASGGRSPRRPAASGGG